AAFRLRCVECKRCRLLLSWGLVSRRRLDISRGRDTAIIRLARLCQSRSARSRRTSPLGYSLGPPTYTHRQMSGSAYTYSTAPFLVRFTRRYGGVVPSWSSGPTSCFLNPAAASNCSVSRACEARIVAQPVSSVAATVNNARIVVQFLLA